MILKYNDEQINQIVKYLDNLQIQAGIKNINMVVNIINILDNPIKDEIQGD